MPTHTQHWRLRTMFPKCFVLERYWQTRELNLLISYEADSNCAPPASWERRGHSRLWTSPYCERWRCSHCGCGITAKHSLLPGLPVHAVSCYDSTAMTSWRGTQCRGTELDAPEKSSTGMLGSLWIDTIACSLDASLLAWPQGGNKESNHKLLSTTLPEWTEK